MLVIYILKRENVWHARNALTKMQKKNSQSFSIAARDSPNRRVVQNQNNKFVHVMIINRSTHHKSDSCIRFRRIHVCVVLNENFERTT